MVILLLVGKTGSARDDRSLEQNFNKEAINPIRAKARYYFLEGSIEASRQNMDKAYEYFKKAYETDPEFYDASFTYGSQRLFVRNDTLQNDKEMKRSLDLMRSYVDSNPRDLYATQLYGYITTALDTVEESVRVYENTYLLLPKETQLLQTLADAYMREMKHKEALESLERYEKIEGKSKDISLKKITIKLAAKDTVGALEEANLLVSESPRDPFSYILKGNLFEAVGQMDSVLSNLKEAERLAPENGAVKMNLAQYYRTVGDSIMLDNMIYEALLSEDIELEDKLGILADYLQKLLEEKGDERRGDYLFMILQAQYPHEPEVLEMSARYSGAKGNYEEAAEEISYAIDMDPTNEMYWLMLLSYNLAGNEYETVVRNYSKAIEHFTPGQRLKNLYAAAVSMLDDKERAENILNSLIEETDPRLSTEEGRESVRKTLDYDGLTWVSSLYCMLGDLYYKNGEPEKAFQEYDISLSFLPDNALTLNNFAYFLSEENKDLEKAKKMSRRSIELVENNPTYLDTYAWVLFKLGDYHEAMEYIKLALEIAEAQGDDNEEYTKHYEAIEKAIKEVE